MTQSPPAPRVQLRLYLGHGNATGDIAVFSLDPASGALEPQGTVPSGSSTSFMAFDPSRRFLYTTQNRTDRLSAFEVDPATGLPSLLGRVAVPTAPGASEAGPSYLRVDASGRFVLCANYRGHNVVVFARQPDGRLGPPLQSLTAGQHAHAVVLSPDQRFAFVPFLGTDRVAQYRWTASSGLLTPNDPPTVDTDPGTGPRHLTFHPNGRHAYLIGELDGSVLAFDFDANRGTLTQRQRIDSFPPGYQGKPWSADIHVHPSGAFLYASSRGAESLAVFAVAPDTGRLDLVEHHGCHGQTPRSFCLDPAGRFLFVANQGSSNLVTFAIHPESGRLHPLADRAVAPSPTFVGTIAPLRPPGCQGEEENRI